MSRVKEPPLVLTTRRVRVEGVARALALVGFALSTACAGLHGARIMDDAADCRETGFRYYESSPYILVYADGKSLKSELVYLPDRTRKMAVGLFDFLSSNTLKLSFTNGVLTSSENAADATAVPKAVIQAAKDVAAAAAKGGAFSTLAEKTPRPTTFAAPPPYLFKLVVDGAQTHLIAGTHVTGGPPLAIKVNVPEEDAL